MFFIRRASLFKRKGAEDQCLVCHKRSEGRLKRYESCSDTRAWSLDRQERTSYILDFMSCIARTDDKLVKDTNEHVKGKSLEGTSSQGKVSPSQNTEEYTSEVAEQIRSHHGKGTGYTIKMGNSPLKHIFYGDHNDIPIQPAIIKVEKKSDVNIKKENKSDEKNGGKDGKHHSLDQIKQESFEENILDDISESSLNGKKSTHIAALQPNPDNDYEYKIGGEDETHPPSDHIKQESFEESILDDISESSLNGEKFTQIAALQPNPDNDYEYKIGGEYETRPLSDHIKQESFEASILDDISESSLNREKFTQIAALKPNPANDYEYKIGREGETHPPSDHIKQESFEMSISDEISESSLHREKFTYIAALRPNPARECVCRAAKELLTFYERNASYGEDNVVSLEPENVNTETKSDETIQKNGQSEGKTCCAVENIKQESFDDISEYSLHGEIFTQTAALQPNPEHVDECAPKEEFLNLSKENIFYFKPNGISLQHAGIKVEKNFDDDFQSQNHSGKKNGEEYEKSLPLDNIKQESVAESILDDIFESSIHGEKFTQIAALRTHPDLMALAHEYLSDVAQESVSVKKEETGSYYEHVMANDKGTYTEQLTSSAGLKKQEKEVLSLDSSSFKEQMEMTSNMISHDVVNQAAPLQDEVGSNDHEYRSSFANYPPATSSKYAVMNQENPFSDKSPSIQYVSGARLPTITISEIVDQAQISVQNKKVGRNFHDKQRDPQAAVCACNAGKQSDHTLKTDKLQVNIPTTKAKTMTVPVREGIGYDNGTMDSSQYPEEDLSFDSDSDFCKQHVHACREAKQLGSASRQDVELPANGRLYFLIPVPQQQRTEFSFSEKEVNCCDVAEQPGHAPKKDKLAVDLPAFEVVSLAGNALKHKEEIPLPDREANGSNCCKTDDTTDSSQYIEDDVSFETESIFQNQHVCACREAKQAGSVSEDDAVLPGCGKIYFLIPVSQSQGTEFNVPGQEGKSYGVEVSSEKQVSEQEGKIDGDEVSSETPVTDYSQFSEHEESLDKGGNIYREKSDKVARSFDVERKFYKEQMDAAIIKLNDRIRETEQLRAERDSLKTELDAAQHYIEQHKKDINKLTSMRKVDEQLSKENESLLKKIYQLSHTAYDQQMTISKLKLKLKQKSKHGSYTQLKTESNDFIYQQNGAPPHWHLENSSSSGKDSGDFKAVHILFPASENNLMMPHKSVFLESYAEYPLQNSATDAAGRYNNMIGDNSYSFSHINGKKAFVKETVNHVQITAIADYNPQYKNYLDLKNTIRREKDDLLKVTKLIQFQQGIISNLSNCIDNEKMLLSELHNTKKD